MDDQAFQRLLSQVDDLEALQGIDMNELLNVPDELSQLLSWMVRQHNFLVEDLAAYLACETAAAQVLLERLTSKSLVEEVKDTTMFQVHLVSSRRSARKYRVSDDVWKVFD